MSRAEEGGEFHQETAPNEEQIGTAQQSEEFAGDGRAQKSQEHENHPQEPVTVNSPKHQSPGESVQNVEERGDEFPMSDTEILQRMIDYDAARGVLPTHNQISMTYFVNIWLRSEAPPGRVRERIEKLVYDYVMGRLTDPEQINLCYTIWGPQETVYAHWSYKWSFFHHYHQHYAYWYNWYF